MKDNNFTSWDHFKKNYKWTALFLIGLFVATLTMEIVRDSESWWFSLFFLFIAVVVLPIGNYLSWKKKFGKK